MFLASLALDRRIDRAVQFPDVEYEVTIQGMIAELRDEKNGRVGMVQTGAQREVIRDVLRLRHARFLDRVKFVE